LKHELQVLRQVSEGETAEAEVRSQKNSLAIREAQDKNSLFCSLWILTSDFASVLKGNA